MTDTPTMEKPVIPELSCLLHLLRRRLDASQGLSGRHEDRLPALKDLPLFYQLLEEHDVESLLFESVRENAGLRDEVYFPRMAERVERKRRRNLQMLSEMVRLQAKMKSAGIPFVFYKGVLLSVLLYGDLTARTSSDIDVLIPGDDFPSVRKVLLEDGYEELYPYTEKHPQFYLRQNREASFRKVSGDRSYIYLEVQWSPLPAYFGIPYGTGYFFLHTDTMRIAGGDIPVLQPTQQLLLLVAHHGISDLWRNLRSVSDLASFLSRFRGVIDWDEFYRCINQWQLNRTASTGFFLSESLFGVSPEIANLSQPSARVQKRVLDSLLGLPLLPKKKKSVENIRRQLLLCDSLFARLKLLHGYLNSAWRPGLEDVQSLPLPRLLFPLYYVTKRFRFLRSGKAHD